MTDNTSAPAFPWRKATGLLFALALLFRVFVLPWDAGTPPSPHPDERQVVSVAQSLHHWGDDPKFFAYGSLHFELVHFFGFLQGSADQWSSLMLGGRMLSLLASMGCLLIGFLLAAKAWGKGSGLIFLLIAAWMPMDLQLSHYATVEAHHALWVMLFLGALFQLARTTRWNWALLSGICLGASLAIKISSLGLLLPLGAVALLLLLGRIDLSRILLLGHLLILGALTTFYLGEPWAFEQAALPWRLIFCGILGLGLALFADRGRALKRWTQASSAALGFIEILGLLSCFGGFFPKALSLLAPKLNPTFLRDTGAQIAMVSGALELPYVRIYRHSLPFLYSFKNLLFWGLGPGLLLAAIWASFRALRLLARRRKRVARGNDSLVLLLILLSWALPMALRLSTLQVKFLRYFDAVIIPLALLAAWGLSRLPKKQRKPALILTAASSLIWGLAYAWAMVQPHPFATAASWLQGVVAEDAVVAWEHWDEHLPSIGSASLTLNSYDLPDNEAKVHHLVEVLHDADWLVLTSNRVRRTVLANPELYPLTGNFYRLLLSGQAGYEIVSQASRSPRIWGLEAPVQRADESFLNYEFPRVLVLRRNAKIDIDTLALRCAAGDQRLEALDSSGLDRLFVDCVPEMPYAPSFRQQASSTLIWLISLLFAGISLWILLLPLLRSWPDTGFGLSLVSAWVLPAWMLWMASELFHLKVDPATATIILLLPGAAAGLKLLLHRHEILQIFKGRRQNIFRVFFCFLLVFTFFLILRAGNPAIYWGEKPMDFSFFNAFLGGGGTHWPPGEPWMAGQPLHYYYFGEILNAFPTLLLKADSGLAYNLCCATIPALSAALLAALGLLVAGFRERKHFFLLPVFVLLTGNLAWPWLMDLARSHRFFDLWWATSRVIPGFAIDEYPLWTAVFSDLHAHFTAIPLFLAFLAWAWVAVNRPGLPSILGCALMAGVLAATNPWDLLMATAFISISVLATAKKPAKAILLLSPAALCSLILVAPFLRELGSWLSTGTGGGILLGFNTGDFAPWDAVLKHLGLFLLPLGLLSMPRRWKESLPTAILCGIGIFLGLSLSSSAATLALGLGALDLMAIHRSRDRWQQLAWALAATAMLGIVFAERFTLIDRMNTIFKIYNGVWIGLALALGILILRLRGTQRRLLLWTTAPLLALGLVNLPLGVLQGWAQPRISSPRPTLDGRAFLGKHSPSDDFVVGCLRGAARPDEIIAEAAGPSYQDFTRIAMHTGLPTLVGWEWHLRQRGQDPLRISARFDALRELYSDDSGTERRKIIDQYGIDWIICGDLERRHYKLEAENPFRNVPGVKIWARRGNTILYRVDANLYDLAQLLPDH